ncbi:hypothetical protein IQ07DRAFT_638126 [Pyrenochaeta sp. DS3sAY3a]|nr:hypothetical protein IQ07DRAFT_638126 [Pyrenochaeta sp. DS3sAY3a]
MSYLHLTRTRTRERTPEYDTYYPGRLIRRDSNKRSRNITLSDDEDDGHDDYPYSSSFRPAKVSRALTIRNQPSQLERYNIWSDKRNKDSDSDSEHRRGYKTYKYSSSSNRYCDDDDIKSDPEDRYRLSVNATFSKSKSTSPEPTHHRSHHRHESSRLWPSADLFRSREKWSDEAWETRERSTSRERRTRRDSFWDDTEDTRKDEESESWSRYRKIKRTKTEEWRPLSGWRRERIVYGS